MLYHGKYNIFFLYVHVSGILLIKCNTEEYRIVFYGILPWNSHEVNMKCSILIQNILKRGKRGRE